MILKGCLPSVKTFEHLLGGRDLSILLYIIVYWVDPSAYVGLRCICMQLQYPGNGKEFLPTVGTRERIEWEVAKVKELRRRKRKSVNMLDQENQQPTIEVLPKKIRLPPDGTLADLRDALMEENWFEEGSIMKFLLRGDQRLFYSRDQEPVVILAQVFVENGGFRMIHVLESKEVKRRRKKSRVVSARQRNESMRRKAMRNASASSQATGSQASMSVSYSSYTTDETYSESFTGSEDDDDSGSETEGSEESAFEGAYELNMDMALH